MIEKALKEMISWIKSNPGDALNINYDVYFFNNRYFLGSVSEGPLPEVEGTYKGLKYLREDSTFLIEYKKHTVLFTYIDDM
jgi:hypothetical protein